MSKFEELVDAVVDGQLTESAVIDHYYLTEFPYLQSQGREDGTAARDALLNRFKKGQRFSEVASTGEQWDHHKARHR